MELTLHFVTLFLNAWCFHTAQSGHTDPMITLARKVTELETGLQKAGCQSYVARGYGGYGYNHMYDLNGIELDNTVVKMDNGNLEEFEMYISIKASKDGIILLSPQSNPGSNDLVFEIGAGIGGNLYSIVRITKGSSNEVSRVYTPDILSTRRYTNFHIIISNGVLKFSKQGEAPIITYYDLRLKNVKYFGVSAWGSSTAKFLFDCPIPNPS